MTPPFDYAKAIAELDQIAAKVENPETKLDDGVPPDRKRQD